VAAGSEFSQRPLRSTSARSGSETSVTTVAAATSKRYQERFGGIEPPAREAASIMQGTSGGQGKMAPGGSTAPDSTA
jgi:hypothetical protein